MAQSTPATPARHDGQHDFDFLMGSWKIHNRRLRNPLTGSTEWVEFEGHAVVRPLWGGKGNMDEVVFEEPRGRIQGATFRAYDPKTAQWTILWVSDTAGFAWPPVVGEFNEGRGSFYSSEPYQGRQIFCRFLWFSDDRDHCHWEQAFSPDYGQTWETNWMNWLTRAAEPVPAPE